MAAFAAGDGKPLAAAPLTSRSLRRRLLGRVVWPAWGPSVRAYAISVLAVVASTAVAVLLSPYFQSASLVMIYLVGVVVVATRAGRGPSILASLLSTFAFDLFFNPPGLPIGTRDTQYLVSLLVMLGVALVISGLTAQVREQAEDLRHRERRAAALYALSRELALTLDLDEVLGAGAEHVHEQFASDVVVLLPDGNGGQLMERRCVPGGVHLETDEREVADWAFEHRQVSGAGSPAYPEASWRCVPLISPHQTAGVLAVRPRQAGSQLSASQARLLETFANQLALAFERTAFWDAARQAQVRAETERLRSAVLSSISHDLRSPLAAIVGSATSLLDGEEQFDARTRRELTEGIRDEADRMARLVTNLLDMTRLESGLTLGKEVNALEDVIASALSSLDRRLAGRAVRTRLPEESPLVPLDAALIERVLVNLLDNALKYTLPGTPLEISVDVSRGIATVEVADRGPGLPPGDEERAFEKFYRRAAPGVPGAGLGLAICRGIVHAHGGRIWAENRPGGGAAFCFSLPVDDPAPSARDPDA